MHARVRRERIHGRGGVDKTAVAGIKDRATGKVTAKVVAATDGPTLRGFVTEHSAHTATVYTDDHKAYSGLPRHQAVKHSVAEHVNGQVTAIRLTGAAFPAGVRHPGKRCPGLQAQAALGLGKDAQAKLLEAAFPLDGEAVGRCHLVDEDGDIGPRHREPLHVGVVQGPVELTDEPGQRSNLSPEIVNVGL